jgi:signal transduction histidine kinase
MGAAERVIAEEDYVLGAYGGEGVRPRILVVDDENGPRQALRMLLKEEHEVLLATDVSSALQILEEESVNLVITDIRMPQRSGVDLLKEVKRHYPDTQVIILTGYAHLETAMQAVEFGAFAYLEKPFDNDTMLERIQAGLARYEQERERRIMEELAIDANRFETIGRLAAGMIHDMGTPLSFVSSSLDMLLSDPHRADASERLETMNAQIRHCRDLVRSTMNILHHDRQAFMPFHINDVVDVCLEVARPMARKIGIDVATDLGGGLPSSAGDLVLVRQAVLNLLTNAFHAMESQKEERRLFIQTWSEGEHVCLLVADTGPGVRHEHRDRIFDTFFTTKGRKGTGLGLAVVHNVMQRHRGSVSLERNDGRGARFVLRFPIATADRIVEFLS